MHSKKMLQDKLIIALRELHSAVPHQARLKHLEAMLKTREIPEEDYSNVSEFIFLLLQEMPQIFDAKTHSKKLRALYIFCVDHMASKNEARTKNRPSNPL
jgi:hypothetical protein